MTASTDCSDGTGRPADVAAACPARCWAHERHRSRHHRQALRRPRGRRRCLVLRRGGRDLRHPRPERRRQDHHRRVHRGPADPRLGHDHASSASTHATTETALRQQVGVQLQESQLPDQLRVWEALDLYASFYETPADWERLIDDLGLTTSARPPSASCRAGRSSGCRSRWPSSATRASPSSTS